MSDLKRRVTTLERARGDRAPWCECPGDIVIIWHEDGEPAGTIRKPDDGPPQQAREVCEKCGKPVRVVTLQWLDALGGDATG